MNLKRILIIFGIIALIAFNYIQDVKAGRSSGGSALDPLVTKSYADQYLDQAFGQLQQQLFNLEDQILLLRQRATAIERLLKQPIILTLGKQEAYEGDKIHFLTAPPYTRDGRTMLPFRFLGEIMGVQVGWDSKTNSAIYQLASKKIEVTIGSKYAKINNQQLLLDVAPEVKNGSTMVPVRFITESLGAKVDWKPETQQIIIFP